MRRKTGRSAKRSNAPQTLRLPQLDALRGGAVLVMIAYHFGYDLNYLHWLHQDLQNDPVWLTARSLILGSFLLACGMSLALAERQPQAGPARWRRIGKIAGAALLVTLGSYLMFPASAIYFGTLHAIAAMSLLLLLAPCGPRTALLLGGLALALGNLYSHALFDHPALAWIGLMTRKPLTEDYVPMLPWFGVCLTGYGAMKWRMHHGNPPAPRRMPRLLVQAGRHSLAIYLLHQPLLLGMLIPATHLLRAG